MKRFKIRTRAGRATNFAVRFPVRRSRILVAVLALAAVACLPAPASADRLVVRANPYVLGQAPDWVDRDPIVWHAAIPPRGGRRREGAGGRVRAGRVAVALPHLRARGPEPGAGGAAARRLDPLPLVERPHGDRRRPGLRRDRLRPLGGAQDGTQATNLTRSSELYDNFHAYWSPNGRYIVWTALNWNPAEGGNGKSDVRVARFDPDGPGGPRLVDEHVVRPGNGHWYETQWWAPDGSGFLYTETIDTAINPELFFCRLRDPARGPCQPVRLTDDPAWDEQAIFSKDMRRVIFMSSRDLPGAHQDWARVATLLDLPADYDYALVLTSSATTSSSPCCSRRPTSAR